jgi:3-oxoadipate enol-lactonase
METLRTKDGCRLAYRIHTNPGKPRLVLIHSLALSGAIWDGVVSELSSEFEILVYDCRGHGESDKPAGPYTVELFSEDLAALLDSCGWTSAAVAGCSMGGCVAQAFAAAYPQRALGLGLIDTTAWYGSTAAKEWSDRAAKAAKDGFASMIAFQLTRWFSESFINAHPEQTQKFSRTFLANDVACYQGSCGLLGNADLRNAARGIRVPVSVIVGEEDYATPIAMSQSLHDMIPGSTLTVIPGGRHLTPVQCPTQVASLLKQLVEKTQARTSAQAGGDD